MLQNKELEIEKREVLGESQKSCSRTGGVKRSKELSRSRDMPRLATSDWMMRKGLTAEVMHVTQQLNH